MKPISLLAILRENLKLVSYKCHTVYQLSNTDKIVRLAICPRFRQEIENDNDWGKNGLFTEEAHFYIHRIVNSQNCRMWVKEIPNEANERPLHGDKCTVRCALSANGIIGCL